MKQVALILIGLLAHQAQAGTVIADFNDNATGPLGVFNPGEGQAGGLGFLTGDVWGNTGTIAVIPGDLIPPAATNYAVAQAPTPQSAQGSFTAGRQTTRELETPLSGTVWISFLLNQPSLDSRGGITLNQNTSAPGNPRIVATGTEVRLGLAATLQGAGGGADLLTLGETALIVARLSIDNTGNAETLDLWINPDVSGDSASLPAPDTSLSVEDLSLDPGVTRVGIQSYSADGQGGIIDSLRLSDALNGFEVVTSDTVILPDDPNLNLSTANPFTDAVLRTEDDPLIVEIALENTGTSNTLTIGNTSGVSGDDAASYSILTPLPLDLAPGVSGVLQLQLDPAGSPRISTAILNLSTNDSSTSDFTIPLATRIFASSGNQLLNGDFESDPATPVDWLTATNTTITEGIAPGSTFSASLAPGGNLRQDVLAEADWYLECFFQAPDTFDRAFNVIVVGPEGQMNLRYQGTSAGAEQTWNLFDNATVSDSWGDPIPLPAVQPGATYFLRITGQGWGGGSPTYDIELSEPNGSAIAGRAIGLDRFQGSIPSGAPTLVRFTAEFGDSPGFILDDVALINGTPPLAGDPEILAMVFDPVAQTTTLTLATRDGVSYSVEASNDLSSSSWVEFDTFTATGDSKTVVENGVTSNRRFYRFLVIE